MCTGLMKWIFLVSILIMVSCKKDNRTELFEINHFVDFNIQPGLNTFDTHFFVVSPFTSVFEARLAASGRTRDEVISIEAKDATLSSIFGDVNLDYIHQISVYIFDPFDPSDNSEFFYLEPVPFKNATSWRLFPGLADISDWIDTEYFGIEIRLTFRQVTPSFTQMRLEFDLRALGE